MFSSHLLRIAATAVGVMAVAAPMLAGTIDDFDLGPYQVIRPVGAFLLDQSGNEVSEVPSVLYDGSGLEDKSPLRGLHDLDAANMWQSSFADGSVSVQFDLGSSYNVTEFWMWNYNGNGESDRGLKSFEMIFKDDRGAVLGTFTDGIGVASGPNELNPTFYCPSGESVRFIELRLLQNHGDTDFVGLAEITFAGRLNSNNAPEPSARLLALMAVIGMIGLVRKRR